MESRLGTFLLAIGLLGGSGYYQGVRSGRWSENHAALDHAAAKVQLLPQRFGEWTGKDSTVDDPDQFVRAGVQSYVVRLYYNDVTGDVVQVMLVCGRPGPISAHTPEVCYGGAGFTMISNVVREDLKPAHYFSRAQFKINAGNRPNLDIAWALTTNGIWSSPPTARFVFGRENFLYKLYVIHHGVRNRAKAKSDVVGGFLGEIVPALGATLFAATDKP